MSTSDDINDIIKSELVKSKKSSSYAGKFNHACNSILISKNFDARENQRELYRIAKSLVFYNIKAIEEGSCDYDYINFEVLDECLSYFSNVEQYNICDFYVRSFRNSNFNDGGEWSLKKLHAIKINLSCERNNFIKYALLKSSYDIKSMALTALIIFSIALIALTDSLYTWQGIFYFEKIQYVENNIFNNFANAISLIFGLDSRQIFHPTNLLGIISLLLYKFLCFVFILNTFIEEIKKRLKV